ncbi:hypothetical protein B296_00050099 [Ensete ventricosum]|uniref:Uncharacterized protein n=1 Tax=Ensete ventricosum TaxID=4639 RepID=A0A426XYC7_ENSVE|nr:hypothetical protein B296_00050099 [Ensete ventricosum]
MGGSTTGLGRSTAKSTQNPGYGRFNRPAWSVYLSSVARKPVTGGSAAGSHPASRVRAVQPWVQAVQSSSLGGLPIVSCSETKYGQFSR